MAKFFVKVREVHVNLVEVEAESAEEARDQVAEDVPEGELSYDFTTEPEYWTVEDANGSVVIEPEDLG